MFWLIGSIVGFVMGYIVGARKHSPTSPAPALDPPKPIVNEPAFDPDEAREIAIARARRDRQNEIEQMLAEPEEEARRTLLAVMERNHLPYVAEASTAQLTLPSDDVKGRIIGREGRNIRSFELVTGTDLLIDDTPGTVTISSFDAVRRETARLTLANLILDGRITPQRIEEEFARATREIHRVMNEAGTQATKDAGIKHLPPEVVRQMGALKFRQGLGQNVLVHSVETAQLAAMLAAELGADPDIARTAGFLHDIGKGLSQEWEGSHAMAGMNFLNKHKLDPKITRAVGSHHREFEPESSEAQIVIVADSISATRPGARRESLDQATKRVEDLENLAKSIPGVDKCFAIQAGREIRVIVKPDTVNDEKAELIAKDLAEAIAKKHPEAGSVKVVVIRETRFEAQTR